MPDSVPDTITRYFEAADRGDTDALMALFTKDAVVIEEARIWRGRTEISAWQQERAARQKEEYTPQMSEVDRITDDEYLVTGDLKGEVPGGQAKLQWRFRLAPGGISHLHIAP
jgi:ketosteroid isomerase-like protein